MTYFAHRGGELHPIYEIDETGTSQWSADGVAIPDELAERALELQRQFIAVQEEIDRAVGSAAVAH